MQNEKIIQVCDIDKCLAIPFTTTAGNLTHTFCCQNGFEQSLKDFQDHLAQTEIKKHQQN
jgi:hypothetical protein